MRRIQREMVLTLAVIALAALAVPARGAWGQAVFSGSGGSGPDLGIGRMIAPYAIVHAAADWIQLGGEVELREIRPNGPAAGRVQDGDMLVAVDGALITTHAGSEHLFDAQPGRPLRLTIRRGGRDREVVVVPTGEKSPTAEPRVPKPAPAGSTPRVPAPGWLGIGVSCRCTVQSSKDGGEIWSFDEAPAVFAVRADGPAVRAGVRVGDLVETIDGVLLTTAEGGRRWSTIVPGQSVRLGIRRGQTKVDLVVRAAER
jgi:C-terminal processing protease CtpA/Prc